MSDQNQKERENKMKHSNLNTQLNQFFGSALFALSLFGFLFPHHVTSATSHHRVNMTEQIQTRQSDDNSSYVPPDSPGSHREFGS
jgi:hypothetical protein